MQKEYTIDEVKEMSQLSAVLLFDRDCILCSRFVQWVIPKDKTGEIKFMALQSIEEDQFRVNNDYETVFLFHKGFQYEKSDVTFQTMKILGLPWKVLYPLSFIPRIIRDSIYSLIARNRYKWFGKEENCLVMTEEIKSRFIL